MLSDIVKQISSFLGSLLLTCQNIFPIVMIDMGAKKGGRESMRLQTANDRTIRAVWR